MFRYKSSQALLLIVTENTLIRDKFITIPEEMTEAQFDEAKELMTRLFVGKEFGEVSQRKAPGPVLKCIYDDQDERQGDKEHQEYQVWQSPSTSFSHLTLRF